MRQVGQSKEREVKKLPEDDDSEGDVGHKMDCVSISLCCVLAVGSFRTQEGCFVGLRVSDESNYVDW